METLTEKKTKHVKGWGIDADPRNEPTYPMKNYTGDDHNRLNYERPPLQEETVEVLHSNERPSKSAVFGTSAPLSGISGFIRRLAFKYSESSFGHWFPLIFADRVNVWEGYFKDFRRGHIPNVFAERGMKAEWKYNKKQLITRVAVKAAIAGLILVWALRGPRNKKKEKLKTLARYI